MTISTTTSRVDYTGNGVTTAFAVPFVFFGADELRVIQRVIATGVETVLALSTNYTVSGGNGATGTVTATSAPPATVQWTILRNTARTQTTAYPSNDPFPASSHERALDRVTAIAQEIERDAARSVRVAETDTNAVTLPSSVSRAGLYLAFDASGNPIAAVNPGAYPATAFAATLLDDTDAAAARATLSVWGRAEAWVDVASAGTTDLGAATSPNVRITGTTTITSFGTVAAGTTRQLRFAGALTLTHNATSLILPGGVSIVTAADDRMVAVSLGAGNWIVTSFTPAAGYGWQPIGGIQVATSLSTIDIALPTAFTVYRFTAWRLAPSVNSGILWRISTDGGATYRAGGTDYDTAFLFANSATPQSGAASAAQVDLTGTINATDNRSRLHIPFIDPGSASHRAGLICQAGILDSGPLTRVVQVTGAASANGRATHMRLLPSGGNLSCAYLLEGFR